MSVQHVLHFASISRAGKPRRRSTSSSTFPRSRSKSSKRPLVSWTQTRMESSLQVTSRYVAFFCGDVHTWARPKSSLGDKMIARKDCKNCFKEGESKHLLGYGIDAGKIYFSWFFHKNMEETNFSTYFLFFSKILKMFHVFAASGGGALENLLSPLLGR